VAVVCAAIGSTPRGGMSGDTIPAFRRGHLDIVAGEHRGGLELAVWENDGAGRFTRRVVDQGKESHLGSRVFDLDGDGDLDLVSIAWDRYQFLHMWRNDAVRK
jgi:hypothetical protein